MQNILSSHGLLEKWKDEVLGITQHTRKQTVADRQQNYAAHPK